MIIMLSVINMDCEGRNGQAYLPCHTAAQGGGGRVDPEAEKRYPSLSQFRKGRKKAIIREASINQSGVDPRQATLAKVMITVVIFILCVDKTTAHVFVFIIRT